MKKITERTMLILMMLFSIFSLFGCESNEQKATKKIEQALFEKYGEEFVVDSIGGGYGTMNDNTWKAIARPKNDPNMRVPVEITKDMKGIYDKYLNKVVAKNAQSVIEEMAKSIWGDSRVDITNDTGLLYPTHTDTSMSYEEFIEHYPGNWQLIQVFLNADNYLYSDGTMDQEGEYEKYMSFAQVLSENKYVKSLITIRYISADAYARYDEVLKEDLNVSRFFHEEQRKENKLNIITNTGFEIMDEGRVKESKEEIIKSFDTWKEDRESYINRRGDS